MLYQPGATPQDEEVHIRKGLKARFILAYGAGFQPLLTWGSPKSWGVAPGWVWVGPSALGETSLSASMRALDLSFPAVPSRRYQMPYLCTMLRTSNISYLRAIPDCPDRDSPLPFTLTRRREFRTTPRTFPPAVSLWRARRHDRKLASEPPLAQVHHGLRKAFDGIAGQANVVSLGLE